MHERKRIHTVTWDPSADLRLLRKLEQQGYIELWGVNIEAVVTTKKIKPERKSLPTGFIDSPFATIGNAKIASDETPFERINAILGRGHHADALHLEDHIVSGRDLFATSDTDFLKHRKQLEKEFKIRIMTAQEIVETLAGNANM
ncbi:hypothetical protein J7394_18880 [Ruegeria sp. R13_0]|uniref:hypothetical protein n=1 Tax=Ruegeria sp. R13_0 TaxID=2821099 RepID=UPI001AD97882|nr:hypothetical protein [Ruegeria sp. R13_0]MBO9436292.1 hypothetical protein [Ruegeria sp. R13_0]